MQPTKVRTGDRHGVNFGNAARHEDSLLACWDQLDRRNRALGFQRYDYGDVQSHVIFQRLSRMPLPAVSNRLLQFPEWCAPILWRRLLGLRKQIVPSLFYHLGLSYLARQGLGHVPADCSAEEVAEFALSAREPGEHSCWSHPYSHHSGALRSVEDVVDIPASCAHHTARVGLMLMMVGAHHRRPELVAAGCSAAKALLEYHHWQHFCDGTATISYYPHTRDEVINTGSDAAMLFMAVPRGMRCAAMQAALEGLLQMVVNEQQPDGSWYYCTERYYRQTGVSRFIDGHHTAMVLKCLAVATSDDSVQTSTRKAIHSALERGTKFYIDRLVQAGGRARYFPERKREAGVVGYTEGISALCACLHSSHAVSSKLRRRIVELVPQMMANAVERFVNRRTFDVACCRFLGRPYQIQSARWGSAPLMHAITDFITTFRCAGDGSWMDHQARPGCPRTALPGGHFNCPATGGSS